MDDRPRESLREKVRADLVRGYGTPFPFCPACGHTRARHEVAFGGCGLCRCSVVAFHQHDNGVVLEHEDTTQEVRRYA